MNPPTSKVRIWLLAFRPKTLPAAIAPVLLGVSLAVHDGRFLWPVALVTLLAALLIQIGTNLANDLFDFLKGTDTEERVGPTRATQAGLITPHEMKRGTAVTFGLAILLGFYLAWVGGWPIVWIGLASIAAGVAYTGGPYPLGYHGWGDVFVMLFFGLIAVPGTYYLQTGRVTGDSLLLGVAMGAMSTAILVVNNLRDIETDAKTGKRTLAVRLGKTFSRLEYTTLLFAAYLIPTLLAVRWGNHLALYLVYFSLPVGIRLGISVWMLEGAELFPILGDTARLLMFYSVLVALGMIL